ncbi:MAG: hypothetical protein KGZ30_04825 [Anaplasmataceae bacterium]|nr:hypothetical protein [Anaplasmataceae bacterium]
MKRFLFLFSILLLVALVVWGGNYFLNTINRGDGRVVGDGSSGGVVSVLPGGSEFVPGDNGGTTAPSGNTSSQDIVASLVPRDGFGVVVDREVFDYAVLDDDSIIFIQSSGQIARISEEGMEIVSSIGISNLRYAAISPDAQKTVVVFGSVESPQVSVFDLEEKAWEPVFIYPNSFPIWAPNNHRLAYMTEEEGIPYLEVIDLGQANPRAQRLTSYNIFDAEISWKNSSEIIISQRPTAYALQTAVVYHLTRRTLTPLFSGETGLVFKWYPLIDQGVVFTNNRSTQGGVMDLVDGAGKRTKRFSFVAIPRDKCSFVQLPYAAQDPDKKVSVELQEASLLCALPNSRSGYGELILPDDYWQGKTVVPEKLIEVSLYDGTYRESSLGPTGYLDATNIQLGHDVLYFLNRFDRKVYGMDFATH